MDRLRKRARTLALLAIGLGLGLPPVSAGAQENRGGVLGNGDFETGNLGGWQTVGNAFQGQPLAIERYGNPNAQGRFWIGTGAFSDAYTGRLVSRPFTVPQGTLSFRIGGGSAFETRVEFQVQRPIEGWVRVFYASGTGSDQMSFIQPPWDVTAHQGQQGRIVIFDDSARAHINADEFRLLQMTPPGSFRPIPPAQPQPPRLVPVPSLRGARFEEAGVILGQYGLKLGNVGRAPATEPEGTVIAQDPGAGAGAFPGTAVHVTLAVWVVVPDLRGVPPAGFRGRLESEHLTLGRVTSVLSPLPEGSFLSQDPVPGTRVPPGSPVGVTVAQWVTVPDVTGQYDVRAAAEILRVAGLQLGRRLDWLSSEPEGRVLGQDPNAGTHVPPGREVHLTLARWVTVPNLVGGLETGLGTRLEEAGLRLGSVSREDSDQPPGTVLFQTPEAELQVPLGRVVDVTIARPRPVPPAQPPPTLPPPTQPPPTLPPPTQPPPTLPPPTQPPTQSPPTLPPPTQPPTQPPPTQPPTQPPPSSPSPAGPLQPWALLPPWLVDLSDPWWPFALFGLLLGLLILRQRGSRRRRKSSEASPVAFEVVPKTGKPRTAMDKSPRVRFDLSLRPVVDPGEQTLERPRVLKVERL